MLEASQEIIGYAQGKSRADLDENTMLFRALVKCIEIVGEAASRASAPSKDRLNTIQWSRLNGMRNRLIHAYFEIERDIVWETVESDLPALVGDRTEILERGEV